MNMKIPLRLAGPFFGLMLLAACAETTDPLVAGDSDISGGNDLTTIDLDEEYGGLDYEDEQAAFGDAQLLTEAMRDEDLGLTASHPDSSFDGPERDFRRIWVRILWGRLDGRPEGDPERDATAFEPVDWTGGVRVDRGVVVLKRTLLFEVPFDHPLPRDSRQSLGWVSHTGPHKDGVLICIGVPNELASDPAGLPGTMSFATGPLAVDIALADLMAGVDRVVESSVEGNAVSFMSTTERPDACAHGFLGGYWQRVENDDHGGGFFRGRVLNAQGRLVGYLGGRFGVNSEGQRRFFGKLIARDGRVRGLVRGSYGENEDGFGFFHGHWANREGVVLGELKGRTIARGEGAGFFHGVWAADCRR